MHGSSVSGHVQMISTAHATCAVRQGQVAADCGAQWLGKELCQELQGALNMMRNSANGLSLIGGKRFSEYEGKATATPEHSKMCMLPVRCSSWASSTHLDAVDVDVLQLLSVLLQLHRDAGCDSDALVRGLRNGQHIGFTSTPCSLSMDSMSAFG